MDQVPSWLVNFLSHLSAWEVIAFLGVAGFLIWFVIRHAWPRLIGFARAVLATAEVIDNLRDLPEFMRRTDRRLKKHGEQIDGIYHETHSNDGSSIKDATGRIESSLQGLHGRVDAVEADVALLKERTEPEGDHS